MDAIDRLAAAVATLGLDATRAGGGEWHVRLPSEARRTFGAVLRGAERTVTLTAFFIRTPDRNREAVFRRLLRRNLDLGDWRFAVDDHGDIYLRAVADGATLDAGRLDELLGALVTLMDAAHGPLMELGFEVPPRATDPAAHAAG